MDRERRLVIKQKRQERLQRKVAKAQNNARNSRSPIPRVSKLAVVSCFFNPHRGRRRVDIYSRFSKAIENQGLPLFCIEGMFGKHSPQVDSTWQVEIDSDAVFWHKESLLNLAVERLQDRYDGVAWIDADVVYLDTDIKDKIVEALSVDPIVQPWSHIRYLGPNDEVVSRWRPSMSLYNSNLLTPTSDPTKSYPGMCWAASREVLRKIDGIYDRCITGGGDVAWAAGVWGDDNPLYGKRWSPELETDVVEWGKEVSPITGGVVGVVHAKAEHLYHGQVKNRQYVERNAIFGQVNYDPRRDVEVSLNGTLKWSKYASDEMKQAIHDYIHSRKEDD